ncbi:hypothetical protein AMELA_G00276950 [Ameiurus melas]|uniref:Signal recognition particle 9 kDa protein n=1 Tax=Ameiurus melas TaxID=219545 RepID=A0A7J5ZLQ7_AMEME|nr:hypothetical protein AMELA_G00276950 [Ameiurus melas]
MVCYTATVSAVKSNGSEWLDLCVQVRVVLKYRHCDGNLCMKVTDNAVCLQYKTDQAQDVRKIEKLHGKLMRLMVSKESSGVMETD